MNAAAGRQIGLEEAVEAFRAMPPAWQLASLHPRMVEVDALRDPLLRPTNWCYRDGERCFLHCFELGSNPGLAVNDVQSAYGYGGPLSNSDDATFLSAAQDAFQFWAQEHSIVAEFLRFHPLIPHSRWYSGNVASNRETVHMDLSRPLFVQYQTRRRTDVRRFSESGVSIRKVSPDTMNSIFPELYRTNMERIGAAQDYYFPLNYFEALLRFEEAEGWLAWQGDTAIAGAIFLVSASARVVEYHLGAQLQGFERQRAMVGLLHLAAEHYQSEAFQYLYLGGGRSVAPDDSLLFFKRGFSSLAGHFQTASKILDPEHYAHLTSRLPEKAATGRVLFYKD